MMIHWYEINATKLHRTGKKDNYCTTKFQLQVSQRNNHRRSSTFAVSISKSDSLDHPRRTNHLFLSLPETERRMTKEGATSWLFCYQSLLSSLSCGEIALTALELERSSYLLILGIAGVSEYVTSELHLDDDALRIRSFWRLTINISHMRRAALRCDGRWRNVKNLHLHCLFS